MEEYKKEEALILDMIRRAGDDGIITTTETGGGSGGSDGLTDKELKKAYDARIKQIEQLQQKQANVLKESLKNNEITEAEYNARMNLLTMQGLQQRIDAAKQYGQDATKYTSQLLDEEIKLVGTGMGEVKDSIENYAKPNVNTQANEQFWDEIYRKRADIVARIQDDSLKTEYDKEMMWLEKLHQYKLLSEEQFEKAKLKTKLNYAQQYADQANSIAAEASNVITAIKEAESAKLEAQYQKDLTNAGNNAERRERIEAEYEQKKLDLQKKYADVDMTINIAKTVANGAAAVVKALADPGGVAGYILAGLVGVNTAAEVATIVAQRNAIKATSVGGGGGSPKTGERKMTGYSEGGNTQSATSDNTPVGIVHANEWVAPAWMVRQEPVVFKNLEQYRKSGGKGHVTSSATGFAEGGFTGRNNPLETQSGLKSSDVEDAVTKAIENAMKNKSIRAHVVRSDITELDEQDNRLKKQTSRN